MAREKQTVGLKLDMELAAKFKELQGQAGSAQEFVEILLAAYAERQNETDTASPVYNSMIQFLKIDMERSYQLLSPC